MKFRTVLLLLVLFITMSMTHQKKTKIIFFGDSITQAGVNAGGYIARIKDSLDRKGIGSQYELVGAGIGGNKVYDLYLRLEDDVLSKSPDVVFIWVGVNDVWHKASSGTGTDAAKFTKFYEALIKKIAGKKHPGSPGHSTRHRRTYGLQQPAGRRPEFLFQHHTRPCKKIQLQAG